MSEFPQEELLNAYLDGELSAIERAEVEKLLADDAAAKAMLEELRGVSSAVKGLPAFKLDEDLGSRVLKMAERRMLADTPADITPKPSTEPFWRTARRRFLTPRSIAWSTTVVVVAILLSVYAPEEDKHGPNGPIAMDMKSDIPGKKKPASMSAMSAKEDAEKAEFTGSTTSTSIAEKPTMKRPDAGRHPASKGGPIKTNRRAMPGLKSPSLKSPSMGMGGGMGGMGMEMEEMGYGNADKTSLAGEDGGLRLKRGSGHLAKSAKKAKAEGDADLSKFKPPTITVNCYFVSSSSVAQKTLEKILLSQQTLSNKQLFEPSALNWDKPAKKPEEKLDEKQIARQAEARQRTVATESETISIEATPAQLEQVLVDIRNRPDVFRDCSDDAKSQRRAFDLRQRVANFKDRSAPADPKAKAAPQTQPETGPKQQQAAQRVQTRNAPPRTMPAFDKSTNYRVVFVLQSGKSQPAAASDASPPAKE